MVELLRRVVELLRRVCDEREEGRRGDEVEGIRPYCQDSARRRQSSMIDGQMVVAVNPEEL